MTPLKSRPRRHRHALSVCCTCAALAAVWLTASPALAQSTSSLGQNRSGGLPGSSSPPRMGSSSGMGLSSSGGGLGSSSGMSGNGSGGIGLHGLGGSSTAGAGGGAGGVSQHASSSMPGASAGTGPGMPGSRRTKPKLALKPASDASTTGAAATRSQYDYNYGAEDTGRDSSTIYKSSEEVAPTDNYKFGATDPR